MSQGARSKLRTYLKEEQKQLGVGVRELEFLFRGHEIV